MSSTPNQKKPVVVITGASGGLARHVASELSGRYHVVGVDPRPSETPFPGEFHQADYTKRKVADLFREHPVHALIHLGRIRLDAEVGRRYRYNVNVLGTRHLLDLARKYRVAKVIVLSTYHVYGAHHDNHLSINEDDPLRATQGFPELVDATELDHTATAFLLKHPQVQTIVLRPANIIGPEVRNRVTDLLRNEYCPTLLGFDPAMQFLHEHDLSRAIRLCLSSTRSGVYNVAGEGVVSFARAIQIAGSKPIPVPDFLAFLAARIANRLGLNIPRHLIDYFRYPTIISDAAFRADFGYEPSISTLEALRSIRRGTSEGEHRASNATFAATSTALDSPEAQEPSLRTSPSPNPGPEPFAAA